MKRISDEQQIEEYFAACPEAQAVTMAERVRLILRVRKIHPNALDAKRPPDAKPLGRPRKTQSVALKEPERKGTNAG